jgi:AcrR family transcriptional regulator
MAELRAARPGKVTLLRAAVEVMGESGYEGASIRDMAERAGVSVAALYYHFPSKQDLLREFLDEAYDITLQRIHRRLSGLTDPVDRLREIVGTIVWSHAAGTRCSTSWRPRSPRAWRRASSTPRIHGRPLER